MYAYVYREREPREEGQYLDMCMYMYMYAYVYREREPREEGQYLALWEVRRWGGWGGGGWGMGRCFGGGGER